MTELAYEVPTIGEKHQASDQRVSTALTEIKTVLNGRLTANNFAKETITTKKFAKSSAWTREVSSVELAAGEKLEKTPSGTQNTSVLLSMEMRETTVATVRVGPTIIATASMPAAVGPRIVMLGPFRVPANEAWSVEATVNGIVEVAFAYEKGVA